VAGVAIVQLEVSRIALNLPHLGSACQLWRHLPPPPPPGYTSVARGTGTGGNPDQGCAWSCQGRTRVSRGAPVCPWAAAGTSLARPDTHTLAPPANTTMPDTDHDAQHFIMSRLLFKWTTSTDDQPQARSGSIQDPL
jgi:hypothetical protein